MQFKPGIQVLYSRPRLLRLRRLGEAIVLVHSLWLEKQLERCNHLVVGRFFLLGRRREPLGEVATLISQWASSAELFWSLHAQPQKPLDFRNRCSACRSGILGTM